jgi:hypothetical protein
MCLDVIIEQILGLWFYSSWPVVDESIHDVLNKHSIPSPIKGKESFSTAILLFATFIPPCHVSLRPSIRTLVSIPCTRSLPRIQLCTYTTVSMMTTPLYSDTPGIHPVA